MGLYMANDDHVIPATANAQAFANRFGSATTVEIVDCAGGHVAESCYDGTEVEEWMATVG
jgi:hypothetical protein